MPEAHSIVFAGSTLRAATGPVLRGWETAKFAELPEIPLPGDVFATGTVEDPRRPAVDPQVTLVLRSHLAEKPPGC